MQGCRQYYMIYVNCLEEYVSYNKHAINAVSYNKHAINAYHHHPYASIPDSLIYLMPWLRKCKNTLTIVPVWVTVIYYHLDINIIVTHQLGTLVSFVPWCLRQRKLLCVQPVSTDRQSNMVSAQKSLPRPPVLAGVESGGATWLEGEESERVWKSCLVLQLIRRRTWQVVQK